MQRTVAGEAVRPPMKHVGGGPARQSRSVAVFTSEWLPRDVRFLDRFVADPSKYTGWSTMSTCLLGQILVCSLL